MNHMRAIVLASLTALAAACAGPQPAFRGVRSAAPAEAAALAASPKVVVLDVSSPEDFSREHIPNALSIPRDALWLRVREIPSDPSLSVLVYDAQGRRAHSAGVLVADETEDAVYELSGGLQAWTRAGLPVVRSESVARLDR